MGREQRKGGNIWEKCSRVASFSHRACLTLSLLFAVLGTGAKTQFNTDTFGFSTAPDTCFTLSVGYTVTGAISCLDF